MKKPLPVIDGVGPSCFTLPDGHWKHILEFLVERFPDVSSATWITRMAKGKVVDNKGIRLSADTPYRKGATIFYYREVEGETIVPFREDILYRDDDILVVDKPHFLPVVPSGRFLHETLLVRLKLELDLHDLVPIHRIDRETAGVVIFSHNPRTRGAYASLFQKREVTKVYEALASNLPATPFPTTRHSRIVRGEPFFRMKEVKGEPNAETMIDILENMGNITRYRLQPATGRKHQLRVHLAALGIPIVNDRLYPEIYPCEADDFSLPLKLIAKHISFQDPMTGQLRHFKSNKKL